MPRKAKPTAFFDKKAQRWRARYKVKLPGTYGSEEEAQRAADLASHEDLIGTPAEREEMTVAQFAELWMQVERRNAEGDIVPGIFAVGRDKPTMRHNAERISTFVDRYGSLKLAEIDREIAQTFWLDYKGRGPALRAMFNDALAFGKVTSNPFARLGLDRRNQKKRVQGRKRIQALTSEEVDRLAAMSDSVVGVRYRPMFRAAIIFAAYSGLRFGEQAALHWDDIDFANNRIVVHKQWRTKDREYAPLKAREQMTEADGRTIILYRRAELALREIEETYGRDFSTQSDDPELIFTTPRGRRLNHGNHYYYWSRIRSAFLATLDDKRVAQLRGNNDDQTALHWHDLRHYHASQLMNVGHRSADVAKQLGHADATLVEELYGHTYEAEALERLRALDPSPPKKGSKRGSVRQASDA